jgi:putative endonuclease
LTKHNDILGRQGEALAAAYLENEGYVVLDRRYRFERAELDLVCFHARKDGRPGGEIVFVEVKTRSSNRFGRPEDAVLPAKRRSIAHAAKAYLYERKMEGALSRFDVVSISLGGKHAEPIVRHFKHAFTA